MRRRPTLVIENITPRVNDGRHAVKRAIGEPLVVEADVFKDGHEEVMVVLKWRKRGTNAASESFMLPLGNDRWQGTLVCAENAAYEYTIEAWGDAFLSWKAELEKKCSAGLTELGTEIAEGAALLRKAARRCTGQDAAALQNYATELAKADVIRANELAHDPTLAALMRIHADRLLACSHEPWLPLFIDRPLAVVAAWYEFFPRSAEGRGDRGSTFRDCLSRVRDAKAMGFDVIYFPPIHPIGETKRKGANNSLVAKPGDPGVPYAIGNYRQGVNGGGHCDVAPELGTLEDFDWLVAQIRGLGMEVALDFAINCSPDHPYVRDHPEWFYHRPDGSIKYAENPPKKYEDVYPLNFHNPDWQSLWKEMRDVLLFWCERGVRIFRVDNPHTKPVAFWEYVIEEVRTRFPDTIFLSEAFTRPKMMKTLAKVGFTQSYTYFTWRNTRAELVDYVSELTRTDMQFYFRANFFANTPDILPFYLQQGGRAAFRVRALLAATLSPVYGIYSGFELCENTPLPGREEYLNSEKYQFKARDWDAPGNIKPWITKINEARKMHRCLRTYETVRFHGCENQNLLVYSKITPAGDDRLLIVVNLDPHCTQSGFVQMPLSRFCLDESESYTVRDELSGRTYEWRGEWNYVELSPEAPAHLLTIL